tara:strand:- start:4389 stop:4649 length:261 start_codon:yes stop_codon:yes gene_type:complete
VSSPNLQLYYFEACPYCQMVLEVIEELNVKVELLDIRASQTHLGKLVADTGRRTVPCLYIDGKPMHESAEIARWLTANAAKLPKNS